ncbi:MAG: chloride channel protein [Kiritimatiellae bacterium]|nr:chloride channel protein [Kiritimatiellia bacterium]
MGKKTAKKRHGRVARTGRRLSKSSWKFFWAGDGMSFRTGRYFGESMLVGVLAGFVVVGFEWMIRAGDRFIFESAFRTGHTWAMAILPAVGALAGYLLIKRFASLEHARGTDSAILAYHRRHGYVPPAVIPIKSTASVLTVASGGSAGYEGPVTLLGASCGSMVASWFGLSARTRRILMTAGLSAGIAALFKAPLAGAIFGFEILYSSSDLEYEPILPCFIASAISYTIYACFFGWQPMFHTLSPGSFDNSIRLLPYFILAFVVAFGSRFYIMFFRATERAFSQIRLPGSLKVVAGGLATGAIGLALPPVLGTSYGTVGHVLNAEACAACPRGLLVSVAGLFAFFVLKVVATSFTVGSGGSGGVFAPAIACGGVLGMATGIALQALWPGMGIHPASFAIVGMAGFLASCNRIPIAAIVLASEMSGNFKLLLPAMWVCCISFWLNGGWTLYRSQVHNREASPVHSI